MTPVINPDAAYSKLLHKYVSVFTVIRNLTVKNSMHRKRSATETQPSTIARIQTRQLTLVMALVAGVTVFLVTLWLMLDGNMHQQTYIQLLSHYFVGYSISWRGALMGAVYGMLFGAFLGGAIGKVYNRMVKFLHPLN